jgi:hypothetical protein
VFCQCLFAKCHVNTKFAGNILFTDEAGFTRDSIEKFHNTHVRVDDSPYTTVASKHQHRFSINVWVGILGQQLLDAVYHLYLTIDLPVLFEHVPIHQRHVVHA